MVLQVTAKLMAVCGSGLLVYACMMLYQRSEPGNDGGKRGERAGKVGQNSDQGDKSGCESCDSGLYRELACAWYRVRAAGVLCVILWFHYFIIRA